MPTALGRQVVQQVVISPSTFATTLLTLFVDTYGTEGFKWAPDTIRMEVNDDFRVQIPDANFDRLMAAVNLVTSDDFYRSLPDFITYCNILSGDTYDPRSWDPADATEIAWGITEGLIIAPPDDTNANPFSDDIVAYIGKALDQEGIINPPDVLKIAVRDKDHASFVAGEYADDPDMFNSIYSLEGSKTGAINSAVLTNLQRLAQQLEDLPLRSGSAAGAVQQMLQSLSNHDSSDDSSIESF